MDAIHPIGPRERDVKGVEPIVIRRLEREREREPGGQEDPSEKRDRHQRRTPGRGDPGSPKRPPATGASQDDGGHVDVLA